jgi:hypothetical protein
VSDLLMEGLKVVGLVCALMLAFGVLYALMLGLWQSITGHARRQEQKVARAWIEGWNAAMRGAEADQAEWVRRMDEELGR